MDGKERLSYLNRYVYDPTLRESSLHNYCETSSLTQSYQRKILRPWLHGLQEKKFNAVLDVGSGVGKFAQIATRYGFLPVSFDISEQGLRQSKGIKVQGEINKFPFGSEFFDAIHCKDSLVHIEDKVWFLLEVSRMLRSEGELLIVSQFFEQNVLFMMNKNDPKDEVSLAFETEKEYLVFVRHYQRKYPEMVASPPYYGWNENMITAVGNAVGLSLHTRRIWQPTNSSPDWHETPAERVVLQFIKE